MDSSYGFVPGRCAARPGDLRPMRLQVRRVAVEPGEPGRSVVSQLVSLHGGRLLEVSTEWEPRRRFGPESLGALGEEIDRVWPGTASGRGRLGIAVMLDGDGESAVSMSDMGRRALPVQVREMITLVAG